jgi:hypothetical protein
VTEPDAMLESLRDRAGERELRLFACACCRRVWRLVPEGAGTAAIRFAERCADGLVGRRELSAAQLAAERAYHHRYGGAAWDAAGAAGRFAFLACLHAVRSPADTGAAREAAECARAARRAQAEGGESAGEEAARLEALAQAALLRDIIGQPLAVPPVPPEVRALATAAAEERRLPSGELEPSRLAALADALQAAGCAEMLVEHLRSPGPHVRGCAALDAVLGKR